MLDRKALLILPALILVTLAGAIWQVTYMARGMAPFVIPVSLAFAAATLAYQARRVTASPEALAAWKKWGSFFLISCAAILTAFQLLPIIRHSGIPLPSSTLMFRVLVAGYGLVLVVAGNLAPKLPPLDGRRRFRLSLGKAGEAAISRLGGWLLVSFGLITIISALLLPLHLISPLMGLLALAMLVAILAKWRQLLSQHGSVRSDP
jgi:uncharacterized membrane protein (DUF2068 family)